MLTGERIRDKIAASKRKGMWVGGVPMLGYDVVSKKLVVNDKEAKLVQHIVHAILEDALPEHVTLFDLAVDPPLLWDEQWARLKRPTTAAHPR